MNPEQQRIAIAEWQGWERFQFGGGFAWRLKNKQHSLEGAAPNYADDVNARSSAWSQLDEQQKLVMREIFKKIEKREGIWLEEAWFHHWQEGLLRTIGKWEDSPKIETEGLR